MRVINRPCTHEAATGPLAVRRFLRETFHVDFRGRSIAYVNRGVIVLGWLRIRKNWAGIIRPAAAQRRVFRNDINCSPSLQKRPGQWIIYGGGGRGEEVKGNLELYHRSTLCVKVTQPGVGVSHYAPPRYLHIYRKLNAYRSGVPGFFMLFYQCAFYEPDNHGAKKPGFCLRLFLKTRARLRRWNYAYLCKQYSFNLAGNG